MRPAATTSLTTIMLATALALLVSAPNVTAHHSLALFSTDTIETLQGTVTRIDWRSPHTTIFVDVKGPGGEVVPWRIETTPTSWLTSEGWTKDSLKPGEQVTVDMNPFSDRKVNYAWLLRITKADGTILLTRFSNRLKDRNAPPTSGR